MNEQIAIDIELLQGLPELQSMLTEEFDGLAGCTFTCAHTCSLSSGS